jgi:Ser-tRNA(Ala) deacylase AlaX
MDPRMHSAEHILNQTMVRMFHCGRCFSAHIEKKKSKCDYRFDRDLTDEEVRKIEERVNEVIQADLPVTEEYLSREESERQYDLDRLPRGVTGEIRVVKIGDYDACPCAGGHVQGTSEIGGFRIVSRTHEDSVLRIRFKLHTRKN